MERKTYVGAGACLNGSVVAQVRRSDAVLHHLSDPDRPRPMLICYARVSTDDQELALQRKVLREADCRKTYAEKVSGARRDRPELKRLLD